MVRKDGEKITKGRSRRRRTKSRKGGGGGGAQLLRIDDGNEEMGLIAMPGIPFCNGDEGAPNQFQREVRPTELKLTKAHHAQLVTRTKVYFTSVYTRT